MRRRSLLGVVVIVTILVCNAYASSWPEALVNKAQELRALADAKKDMPASLEGITVVAGDKAQELWKSKNVVFLDNRIKAQHDTEKIKGSAWFFTDDLIKEGPSFADKLDKSKEYVLYCNGVKCWRSPAAAILLHSVGFKVYWYRDGIPDWKKRGYPTE